MKKGQAAMEFLMTYGWAILVVIAAIAALAYFGVLNPQNWLPEKCEFPPSGLTCLGKAVTTTGATISLRNSVSGMPITVTDATLAECVGESAQICTGIDCTVYADIADTVIPANEVFKLQWDACTIAAGRYDGAPTVAYTSQVDGLPKTDVGSIKAKVA